MSTNLVLNVYEKTLICVVRDLYLYRDFLYMQGCFLFPVKTLVPV